MTSTDHCIRKSACKILVAEDLEPNQVLVRQVLEAAGFAVTIAGSGREAVDYYKKDRYDLVLMDIQMPVMDGFEATEMIRSFETDRRIPIIAFSALSPDAYREKCIMCGMNDFLHKPFQEKTLLRTIRKWVDLRPAILIVDDSRESRVLIENHLKGMKHYRMAAASNGVEAIRAVRDQSIALVLMDMEMPVMDGYTAARLISALESTPTIPIVAMTAHGGQSEIERCFRAGCCDYIQKPAGKGDLRAVISKYLPPPEKEKGHGAEEECVEVSHDLEELIPRYLENRRKDAGAITDLLAAGNLEEIRRLGHSMSGSGGGYGFQKISRLGREIEKAARENNPAQITRSNRRLAEYLENIRISFRPEA